MEYRITMRDIKAVKWALNGEQLILRLLKEKGAPINGLIWLSADFKNYFWSSEVNKLTGDIVYKVNEKRKHHDHKKQN